MMGIRRKMENVIVDTMDRISHLPESIIHHILSYLDSLIDLVRMSILSTYWFGITASFPILIFDFLIFEEVIISSGISFDTNKDMRDAFFKYVEYTISRFCEQSVSMHTFYLKTVLVDQKELDIVERCFRLIRETHIYKVLVIDYEYKGDRLQHRYIMPTILVSSSTLESLTLCHCGLPSFLMVVRFKSLRSLSLKSVTLSEEVIRHLTTSCPLLEVLIVEYCYGFKRFCVDGLLNLQQVQIWCHREVERIEIDAPKLRYLCLTALDRRGAPPSLNLASCRSLTKLCYRGKGLADLSSNFPFVEDLFLVLPDECERLSVSSHSLRTFMLHSKCKLDKIDVDAPKLLLFVFTDDSHFYSPKERILVPSKACIKWNSDEYINEDWFQKLRQFLDKKIRFKELKLHINVGCIESIESETIQWPPIEFEHVELEAECFEVLSFYLCVVDSLLWCCRPQSLTLIIDFSLLEVEEWKTVVKHTYEKLLEQEDQALTNIQSVMSSSSSKDNMNFSDLSSLLEALPRDGSKQKITFVKYRSCSRSRKRKASKLTDSISEHRNI